MCQTKGKSQMKRNTNCRRLYETHHGVTLADDIEVHHILPVHQGGTDSVDNLVALTKEEHKRAHLELYEKTGSVRDLCAYHMIGNNFTDAHKIACSHGGKIGGNKVKTSKIGICSQDLEKRRQWASLGGKAGGKVQHEKKIGIHKQTKEERLALASIGGKRGAFTQTAWQSEFGKRGGPKNKGFVWLTNGVDNIKYSKRQQETKSVCVFLKENPSYRMGRTEPKAKCFKCGKTANARTIGRYHNERCTHDKN